MATTGRHMPGAGGRCRSGDTTGGHLRIELDPRARTLMLVPGPGRPGRQVGPLGPGHAASELGRVLVDRGAPRTQWIRGILGDDAIRLYFRCIDCLVAP